MKFLLFFLMTPFLCFSEDLKQVIADKEKALEQASEKGPLHCQLAVAYLRDQEQEKAFQHYRMALKSTPGVKSSFSDQEKKFYEKALTLYFEQGSLDPGQMAVHLIQEFGPIGSEHANFYHLNALLALSSANLGNFEEFFTGFYKCYPHIQESFIADKALAILNLRLMSAAKSTSEKQAYEKEAVAYLNAALEKNSGDASIYRFLILLAKDKNDKPQVLKLLQKIYENNVKLPRSDIFFYVKEAVDNGDAELGLKIINIARTYYEYSRSITSAEDYVNQRRAK